MVQNVIKYKKLILFFIVSNFCFGQKRIEGTYKKQILFGYEYIDFRKNGSFEYHKGGDLGDEEYGSGNYIFESNKLTLNFNSTILKEKSYKREKTYKNKNDSIKLDILITDLEGKPIHKASIISLKDRYGVESNVNGDGELYFLKENKNIEIDVSHLCCENFNFLINKKFNYEIHIFLNKGFSTPIKNEKKEYQIIQMANNFFETKSKSNLIDVWKKSKLNSPN